MSGSFDRTQLDRHGKSSSKWFKKKLRKSHLNFAYFTWQYRRKDAAPSAGKKAPKKGKDMNELKQELDIDDHKIPIEELYQRLGTNPETVSSIFSPPRRLSSFYLFPLD